MSGNVYTGPVKLDQISPLFTQDWPFLNLSRTGPNGSKREWSHVNTCTSSKQFHVYKQKLIQSEVWNGSSSVPCKHNLSLLGSLDYKAVEQKCFCNVCCGSKMFLKKISNKCFLHMQTGNIRELMLLQQC